MSCSKYGCAVKMVRLILLNFKKSSKTVKTFITLGYSQPRRLKLYILPMSISFYFVSGTGRNLIIINTLSRCDLHCYMTSIISFNFLLLIIESLPL